MNKPNYSGRFCPIFCLRYPAPSQIYLFHPVMWPKASSQTHILSSCNKIKTKEDYMHWVELHVLQRVTIPHQRVVFTIYSASCCRLAHRMPFRTPSYEHSPFNDWTWTMWHRVVVNQKTGEELMMRGERTGKENQISLEICTFRCKHRMETNVISWNPVPFRCHLTGR